MNKLLTKEEVIILKEAAVHWDDSALGMLTNALFRPISWLKGSIKRGIKKQQINNLVNQWGIEYVKAIKAVDMPEEDTVEDEIGTAEDEKIVLNQNSKIKYIEKLKHDNILLTNFLKSVPVIMSFDLLNQDPKNPQFLSVLNTFSKTLSNSLLELNSLLKDNDTIDVNKISEYHKYVNDFINALSKYKDQTISMWIKDPFMKGGKKTIDSLKIKLEDLQDATNYLIDTLEGKKEEEEQIEESYRTFLNEANEYSLPAGIEGLFPPANLEKIKQIDNIKEKTSEKLNFVRLNTIKYEAEAIINKAKNSKDTEDNIAKLQETFDKGVLHINDYFQDVIDIDAVSTKVTGHVDAKLKDQVIKNQSQVDELQLLGLNEVIPVGGKFDIKKLYCFNTIIKGQNGKNRSFNLFVSPTAEYIDKEEGVYWFKLMGAYNYDKKGNKIVRINPFKENTINKVIPNNFTNIQNAYYICFTGLKPGSKNTMMYVYSNKGNVFFNQKIDSADNLKSEIISEKNKFLKIGNLFKVEHINRFSIEDEEVSNKKYPGIELNDIQIDKAEELNNAKTNHEKITKFIK